MGLQTYHYFFSSVLLGMLSALPVAWSLEIKSITGIQKSFAASLTPYLPAGHIQHLYLQQSSANTHLAQSAFLLLAQNLIKTNTPNIIATLKEQQAQGLNPLSFTLDHPLFYIEGKRHWKQVADSTGAMAPVFEDELLIKYKFGNLIEKLNEQGHISFLEQGEAQLAASLTLENRYWIKSRADQAPLPGDDTSEFANLLSVIALTNSATSLLHRLDLIQVKDWFYLQWGLKASARLPLNELLQFKSSGQLNYQRLLGRKWNNEDPKGLLFQLQQRTERHQALSVELLAGLKKIINLTLLSVQVESEQESTEEQSYWIERQGALSLKPWEQREILMLFQQLKHLPQYWWQEERQERKQTTTASGILTRKNQRQWLQEKAFILNAKGEQISTLQLSQTKMRREQDFIHYLLGGIITDFWASILRTPDLWREKQVWRVKASELISPQGIVNTFYEWSWSEQLNIKKLANKRRGKLWHEWLSTSNLDPKELSHHHDLGKWKYGLSAYLSYHLTMTSMQLRTMLQLFKQPQRLEYFLQLSCNGHQRCLKQLAKSTNVFLLKADNSPHNASMSWLEEFLTHRHRLTGLHWMLMQVNLRLQMSGQLQGKVDKAAALEVIELPLL